MGRNKADLTLGGMSLVQRKVQQLSPAQQLLVCGAALPNCEVVKDIFPGCGPMAGIHAALSSCRQELLFAVACDLPFADWSAALALHLYMTQEADAVVPLSPDGRKEFVCALYRARCLPAFERLLRAGRYRLRDLMEVLRIKAVPTSSLPLPPMALMNLNTPEDLQLARQLVGNEESNFS